MIKSWVFELFVPPAELAQRFDPAVSQRHFNAYLDLWASAEPAGFDGIFFSEHHFGAAYSPAPNLLIASIATRTRTLRLGTLGMVAPYHTPWQLIEEIGMLDHLGQRDRRLFLRANIDQRPRINTRAGGEISRRLQIDASHG